MSSNSIINPKSPVLRNGNFLWAYCAIFSSNFNPVNLIFNGLQRFSRPPFHHLKLHFSLA